MTRRTRLSVETLDDRCLLSFSPAVSYPVGGTPVASWEQSQPLVTADFNNDSVPDLAVGNYHDFSGWVSVLLGNGDGTFEPALNSETGVVPLSVAVGDFDGDGNADVATANAYDVTVLMGNGDGTFQAPATALFNDSQYPQAVAVGDFNGDGLLDLGVTSNTYRDSYGYGGPCFATVLLGNGDGSFSGPNVTPLEEGYHHAAVAADLNGDAFDDFVAVNAYRDTVNVLLGDGSGFLRGPFPFAVGADYWEYPIAVAAGDLNADGDIDLVTANFRGDNVSVLLGAGAGGFSAATLVAADRYATGIVLGDFTGDGTPDVATLNGYNNSLSVLAHKGDGTFSSPLSFAVGGYPSGAAAGDFNGDGWLDAAVSNNDGDTVSVLINDHNWPPAGAPSLSIDDVSVKEGNTGIVNATFTVRLSATYSQPVTVHYATADGTATAGSDYVAASGDVTFAPGETSKTITVAVLGDRLAEPNQTFAVNLSAATNAFIGDGQGVGTILDDEPRITISDVTKKEGRRGTTSFTFTVTLSAAYDQPVTVSYKTTNGTATTSDGDYVAKTGTITFNPGETSKTITIIVNGDKKKESNEAFYLDLFGNSSNSLLIDSRGIGTILNDD